jgi:hypothetical protein
MHPHAVASLPDVKLGKRDGPHSIEITLKDQDNKPGGKFLVSQGGIVFVGKFKSKRRKERSASWKELEDWLRSGKKKSK